MTENKKVLKVLNGFSELTSEEKQIFVKELNEYLNLSTYGQNEVERTLKIKLASNLGPTNDRNCPCCGKS